MTDLPIELVQTGPEHIELIRNLYQFYAYESSDWEQEDVEVDGRFYIHEEHLARYWNEPEWSANLILVDGFIAGFVLIEGSELPGIDALELADVFVLKKYRRKGVGRTVATRVLLDNPGPWLVRYYTGDELAAAFWKAVLGALPRPVKHIDPGDDPQLASFFINPWTH
ncbi:GNAT family N-acetyltransferase [Pseudomonas nitroreducens]|uniref:GNAT family N-acetyltransferase n=1 Tax=Pseudomonas TaxID=286 RepID=UPI002F3608F9